MKNVIATTAILASVFASTATAETVTAMITYVEPRYETVYQSTPQTRCQDVQVPIYGTVQGGGATGGDVLGGMIIGGLLGKGVTGKDQGAAAGAVLGGIIAADKGNQSQQVITGYQTQRQCNEVMVSEQVRQLKNYYIEFDWNGIEGSAYTYNNYRIGDVLNATVSIHAQ
jgi:uncharacterized protein YcfJ